MAYNYDPDQIEKEWMTKGSPWCEHTSMHKQYYLGTDTGDYVCPTCGELRSRQEPKPAPRGTRPSL